MRNELAKLISLAQRLLDASEPGTLATLVSASGSSYRSLGSVMVAGPPGVMAGGVSGGCLEEYIARHGRELTRDRHAVLLSFYTGGPDDLDDPKPVLGCGGSIDVLVERLTIAHLDHLRILAGAYERDVASLTTCTIAPQEDTAAATVSRSWERPSELHSTAELARQALCDRRSYWASSCGGGGTLVQYVPPLPRLVIFGAGPDVRPLCDLGHSLGWHVTVADRRGRRARSEQFPTADTIIAAPWEAAIAQIRFTVNTAVVLMTHSLPDDAKLLPLLADKPFAYAGVLGPAHRKAALLELAREARTISEEFAPRLRGPIGLDLGDRSPTGIAVSVASEILAHLNDRHARPMSESVLLDNEVILNHA